MSLREFRRAGHFPSLVCAFLYSAAGFVLWVRVGALPGSISLRLGPRPDGVPLQAHRAGVAPYKGLLVAVPVRGGAVLRLVLGVMPAHWGARRTALVGMALT